MGNQRIVKNDFQLGELPSALELFHVFVFEDDIHRMECLAGALHDVLRLDDVTVDLIIRRVRAEGLSVCVSEPLEHAEFHSERLKEYGFMSMVIPVWSWK